MAQPLQEQPLEELPSQEELVATLTEQATQRRRRVVELEAELRETREELAYLNGQLAILRQITLQPRPVWREGGGDS